MSHELYEVIAQCARYFFVLAMLVITWRAIRGLLVDSRRASRLRRLLPLTGQCGELLVLRGGERAKEGMRYPVIREGVIGSSRRADVRIRHSSVRRVHAYFQLTAQGVFVRTHAGSKIRGETRLPVKEIWLKDNSVFWIGNVELKLILSLPDSAVISTTGHGKHADAQRFERSEEKELRETEDKLFGVEEPSRRRAPREEREESDYLRDDDTPLPEEEDEELEEPPRPSRRPRQKREPARKQTVGWRDRDPGWGDEIPDELPRTAAEIDRDLFGEF